MGFRHAFRAYGPSAVQTHDTGFPSLCQIEHGASVHSSHPAGWAGYWERLLKAGVLRPRRFSTPNPARFWSSGRIHVVEQLALLPVGLGTVGLQAPLRLLDPAAAGGGEGNHRLAGKIISLQERVHDTGLHIPPDGEADEHGVVLVQIRRRCRDGGAAGWIVHLQRAAALLVHPVQVRSGIGLCRTNLIQIRSSGLCHLLRRAGRDAAGGKIGDQYLAHCRLLLSMLTVRSDHTSGSRSPIPLRPRWCGCRCGCSPAP